MCGVSHPHPIVREALAALRIGRTGQWIPMLTEIQ
jgi:hypothetical protein